MPRRARSTDRSPLVAAAAAAILWGSGLAACAPRAPAGPAWPQRAEREEDGGVSLAPRAAASPATAIERATERATEHAPDEPLTSDPGLDAAIEAIFDAMPRDAGASEPAPPSDEGTPPLQELVIEIED